MSLTKSLLQLIFFFFLCFLNFSVVANDLKFAVIGDYGVESESSKRVASLVRSCAPDFIITTGDNNYPTGAAETIDQNIGASYSPFIYPYSGQYEQPKIAENRFWPCLGNHDFGPDGNAKPCFDYLPSLGGKFYYEFRKGPVHFFALCSDRRCPDGIIPGSEQLLWAEKAIKASQAPWKIVYFHHPVYHSSVKTPDLPRWPSEEFSVNKERRIAPAFCDWGVDVVFNGHLHLYERLFVDGVHYVINGAGGDVCYKFSGEVCAGSIVRYDEGEGVMLVEGNEKYLSFKFMTPSETVVDHFHLEK